MRVPTCVVASRERCAGRKWLKITSARTPLKNRVSQRSHSYMHSYDDAPRTSKRAKWVRRHYYCRGDDVIERSPAETAGDDRRTSYIRIVFFRRPIMYEYSSRPRSNMLYTAVIADCCTYTPCDRERARRQTETEISRTRPRSAGTRCTSPSITLCYIVLVKTFIARMTRPLDTHKSFSFSVVM